MINTFRVQNYKALRDVTLHLTPIHLLIGPNDSGKTSLLQAIKALSDSLSMPLDQAFGSRWEGADLVTDGNPSETVVLRAESDDSPSANLEVECQFQEQGRKVELVNVEVGLEAQFTALDPKFRNSVNSDNLQKIINSGSKRGASLSPKLSNDAAAQIESRFHGAELFRWNARLLSLPCALDAAAGFRMLASGFGLARVLDAIIGYSPSRFVTDLLGRYKEYFPDVEDVKLRPEKGFRTHGNQDELAPVLAPQDGKGIVIRFKGFRRDIPAAHLSEGMLLVLAYLAILYSPNPPRLLLVEEPENGIHPERLADVIEILRDIVKTQNFTQVILTSHSPYIVSLFQPEEVTLCRKNSEGYVKVKRLSDSELVKQQLDVFSLGEIWPAEEEAIFAESAPEPVAEAPQ